MASKSILIADDDLGLLQALATRLEAEEYRVTVTQDAYHALALARRYVPDLLLLDINMPAGSGFSVQERIKKIDELAAVPVIYITGEPPESVDQAAEQLGAFAVIRKPFETNHLLDTIRSALGFWSCGTLPGITQH